MDKIVEQELESKQKMPKEMKKDALKEILQNFFMIGIIILLLGLMCFMDEKLIKETFSVGLKVLSTFFVIVSVLFFERAYRKEKSNSFFWAVEFFTLGMILMFVPYLRDYIQKFVVGIGVGFGIYYLVKFLGIYLKKQKEFSDKKSDIKEIVKDEKSGYLDDVSKKKFGKNGSDKND